MITIRSARESDTAQILEIYSPFILNSTTSFEVEVPSAAAFWQRILKIQQDSPWLVAVQEENILGYAYACPHRGREAYRRTRELSVYMHEAAQGKGLARALYNCVLELIRYQGYTNALAGIVVPNEKSVSFHTSMGFKIVGTYEKVGFKFGGFHDVAWYQKFLGHENEVLPLRTSDELWSDPKAQLILDTQMQIINSKKS